jgi:L-ascorbate oxidase
MKFSSNTLGFVASALLTLEARRVSAKTVSYTFDIRQLISNATFSPDCFEARLMTVVNGVMPGPAIVANVGDTIQVTVKSTLKAEAVAIHWHGLHMLDNVYNDGMGTVTQCEAGPMQTLNYEFVAKQVGTHFWHAHASLIETDGLLGPIWIDDPNDPEELELKNQYDEDVSIMLLDWYHSTGEFRRTGVDSEPFKWIGNADALLINGKGGFNGTECAVETIDVEAGKTYRLRIVNGNGLVAVNFAVAGHNLTVVEVDGTLVEPLLVSTLDISPGQRYSVLLAADQVPALYGISTVIRARSAGPTGLAYLRYSNAANNTGNQTVSMPDQPVWDDYKAPLGVSFDAALLTKTVPEGILNSTLSGMPDVAMLLVGTQARRIDDNQLRWAVNNISQSFTAEPVILSVYKAAKLAGKWPTKLGEPFLDVPLEPPTTWNYTLNVTDLTPGPGKLLGQTGVPVVQLSKGQIVQVVMQNSRALNAAAELHPWHLHGHSFYQIGQGNGIYDPNVDPAGFNLVNPVKRDTLTLWPDSWAAFRFEANNPGTFCCCRMFLLLVVFLMKLCFPIGDSIQSQVFGVSTVTSVRTQ